ncbi:MULTISPECIES: isopeptide-forming domain-containing fimbrial protein [Latilactobacillus]|uniref:isopeptide-forming domain-containing fimbrial protein n=1 Tax=Latilactobacillus TaxID=2767885 RepID=UPI0009E1A417|nr:MULTISPECIES: isopeptide-forming domain-containing fimbrial protein [Latilactobacillus]ASN13590.1 hypothetical protein B4V05_10180 [Latilactobacillus sakei]MCW8780776.1 isopeptide-forming domain-containing fimbrial protein [Latilactobacillus curvatus]
MKIQTKVILFSTMLLTGIYLGGRVVVPVQAASNEVQASGVISVSDSSHSNSDKSEKNQNSNSSSESNHQTLNSSEEDESTSSEKIKQVSESDKLYDHEQMTKTQVVKKGSNVTFIIDYQFPNNSKKFKQLVLTDPLEAPFKYKSAKVMTADEKGEKFKDITNLGKIHLDKGGNILTFTFTNPNDYWGQQVRWQIETTLDKNADISKYTNSDGKIEIPNIASYDTGAESKTSDPVKVTPPMDKGAQPKDNTTPPVKADPLPETGRDNLKQKGFLTSIGALTSDVIDWLIGK